MDIGKWGGVCLGFHKSKLIVCPEEGDHGEVKGKGKKQGRKGLKVIDMSRVIAGPIATRTLAVYGADVLLISSPNLPNLPLRELDTARGKHTTFLDLATPTSTPLEVEGNSKLSSQNPTSFVKRTALRD